MVIVVLRYRYENNERAPVFLTVKATKQVFFAAKMFYTILPIHNKNRLIEFGCIGKVGSYSKSSANRVCQVCCTRHGISWSLRQRGGCTGQRKAQHKHQLSH